jgi:hypothetical protein
MSVKKLYVLPFLGIFLLFSCHKEKTTWDSNWVAPLVNDTLSLKNLVNDSTLTTGLSTFYQVDLTRTILNLGIEDIVSIPDTLISHNFNIAVPSLSVPPGFSIVNEIEEHSIGNNSVQLKKIRVSNGVIKMEVFNPVNTKTFFTVQLPGVSKNGVEFQEQYQVPAGTNSNPGRVVASLDISGYDLLLTGISGGDYNILQSRLVVATDPAGPAVTVTNSQVFKVDAEFKNIKIDYARGYFGHKIVSDTSTYTIDFLNNVTAGTVDLPAVNLQFEITNGMKIDAKALLTTVSNTNYQGNTVNLTNSQIGVPIYIDQATGNWTSITNSTTSIAFDGMNSNLEAYLENLGKTHTIGYKLELNPFGNVSGGWNEIFPNSRLKVKIKAQMPLAIGADGLTLRDTFDFDIKQDLEKSHVESGMLVLNVSNAFPLSSSVKLYLMNTNGTVIHTVIGSSEIASSLYGSIDPSDGKRKMSSEVNFILTEAMLDDLENITNIAVETQFNTPDPTTSLNNQVLIPVGAFLAVKLKAKLVLKAIL